MHNMICKKSTKAYPFLNLKKLNSSCNIHNPIRFLGFPAMDDLQSPLLLVGRLHQQQTVPGREFVGRTSTHSRRRLSRQRGFPNKFHRAVFDQHLGWCPSSQLRRGACEIINDLCADVIGYRLINKLLINVINKWL